MATTEADLRTKRRLAAGSYQPSESERDALRTLNEKFKPDDPIRRHFEQQWLTNIAFLIGFQYVTWDPVQRQLIYAQTPSLRWRARAVHNFIRPYVELEVGTVGVFNPAFMVRPKNSDPESADAAEANKAVLTHYWSHLGMPLKKYDLLYWLKTCGNGFIKVCWDKAGGNILYEDEPMLLGDRQINTTNVAYEGEIESSIESPFTVYWDMATPSIDQLQWMIHARAMPYSWVEQHFPERAPHVPLGVQNDNLITRQRWVLDLAGPAASFGGSTPNNPNRDWVLVRELYHKPTYDFPHGRYMIDANGIMLEEPKDNPTPGGDLPFVWCRDGLVPGRLAGQCNVDNLLSLQRSYNRIVSKKEEHIVLTANAKILEHATNELPASSWQTEIGEVIKWHGMQQPGYLVPPPMPPESDTELDRIRGNFDLITSQYGPARGQYPGKVSGKAINYLVEQNMQNKTPMLERLSENLKQWGHLVLEVAQANILEPRLIKILGRGKQWSVQEFQGQDIKGNTEVEIDIDSMIPKSRTMALDLVGTLTTMGWLSPMNPKDRAKVWKALSMEDDAPIVEDETLDLRNARNENKLIMSGVMAPPAQYWEDHDMHMLMHSQQAKSDEFKQAPPLIQEMLKAHMQSHIAIVMPRVGVTVQSPEEEAAEVGPQIGGGGSQPSQRNQSPSPQQQPPMKAFT